MSTQSDTFGTQPAPDFRDAAQVCDISEVPAPARLNSLHDALNALQRMAQVNHQQLRMMRTAAGHFANFLGLTLNQVPLDQLTRPTADFKAYLKNQHYKRHAIRSYVHYVCVLLRKAEGLGWKRSLPEIPPEWSTIYGVARRKGCGAIVRYAIENGKRPTEFGDAELDAWGSAATAAGRTYGHTTTSKHLFRRAVFEAGLASLMPRLSRREHQTYAIPVAQFPTQLRTEVEDMIAWKQADFIPGAGVARRTKLRDVSANNVRTTLGRLYGHAQGRQMRPTNLEELAAQDIIVSYIDWYINQRKLRPAPLRSALGAVHAAITQYRAVNLPWFSELLNSIPKEPKSAIRKRKEKKWAPYAAIAEGPAKIRAAADRSRCTGKKLAMMRRNELLMEFITILPGGRETCANQRSEPELTERISIMKKFPLSQPLLSRKWY